MQGTNPVSERRRPSRRRSGPDLWASRARPTFLYVIYALILWAFPLGVLSGFDPVLAARVTTGMTAYLAGLPDGLYALFGTGYIGYTAARQWGKVAGVDS